MLHRQFRSSRRGLSADLYSICRARSRQGVLCARETELVGTMLKLMELSSESVIDDDAVLVRKIPLANKEARRDHHCEKNISFGSNRCGERPLRQRQQGQASVFGSQRADDSQSKGDHNVYTRFLKYPNQSENAKTDLRNAPMESHFKPNSEILFRRITNSCISTMSELMVTGTLSSYKLDTRTGSSAI